MGYNRKAQTTELILSLGLAIPLYNEEGAVENVLHQTMFVLRQENIPFFIATVNNGSTDQTGDILDQIAKHNPEIIPIHFDQNQGYGGGILSGMRALAPKEPSILGWSWGDGQVSPEVLPKLYRACKNGAQLAKAKRIKRKDGLNRIIQSKFYNRAMQILGTQTKDVNGCPKVFRMEAWEELDLLSQDWFLDAETILLAEKLGWAIHQEPVTMEPRYYNRSKVHLGTTFEFTKNILQWKLKN